MQSYNNPPLPRLWPRQCIVCSIRLIKFDSKVSKDCHVSSPNTVSTPSISNHEARRLLHPPDSRQRSPCCGGCILPSNVRIKPPAALSTIRFIPSNRCWRMRTKFSWRLWLSMATPFLFFQRILTVRIGTALIGDARIAYCLYWCCST